MAGIADARLYFEQFRGDEEADDVVWIDNWNFISLFNGDFDFRAEGVDKWGYNRFTVEPSDGSDEWKSYGDGFNTRDQALDHAFVDSGVWQDDDDAWRHWFGEGY